MFRVFWVRFTCGTHVSLTIELNSPSIPFCGALNQPSQAIVRYSTLIDGEVVAIRGDDRVSFNAAAPTVKRATSSIPEVFVILGDPLSFGLVADFSATRCKHNRNRWR